MQKGHRKPASGEFILRDGWCWPDTPCVKGHHAPRNRFKHCVQCVRDYRKSKGHFRNAQWEKDNKQKRNDLRKEWSINNPIKAMLNACRTSAKRKGIPFNLTEKDVVIPEKCPVFGFPLERGSIIRTNASPSIDRITPAKGYVKGNVIVVSWRANMIKGDASIYELEAVTRFYRKVIK
jgi:hypothetical protein